MSWSGPDGLSGQVGPDLQDIGISSPQSVEKIEVIKLQWEFLSGDQIMRRIEIWHSNLCIAESEFRIGITGHSSTEASRAFWRPACSSESSIGITGHSSSS